MTAYAVDTSVAVALLVTTHPAHRAAATWARRNELALSGHAAIETYSVLTRLPGDLRVPAGDVPRLLASWFGPAVHPKPGTTGRLVELLSGLEIAGGAAYDALVALAARDRELPLATRDARARATYERIGVRVELVG